MQLLRMKSKWAEILELCEKESVQRVMQNIPAVPVYRLRALFETGRLHEAFQYYRHLRKHMPPRVYRVLQYLGADIFLFAFSGRVHSLQKLLDKKRVGSTPMGRYWLATAKWGPGDDAAVEEFKKIAHADDALMRHAVERLLKNPPASTPRLTDAEIELLDAVDSDLNDSCRYGHQAANSKRAYVTLGIAGLIILMFAVELSGGGARNLMHLWHLGALDPDKVREGEYWRLLASIFLHYGWLHVSMNLVALLYFGPFVESSLGHLRFSICYFLSGMGSMLLLVLFIQYGWLQPMIVMGASGSIMGLIGSTGAILFRGWRVDSAAVAGRRLKGIGLLIVLQILFNIITPPVSYPDERLGRWMYEFQKCIKCYGCRNICPVCFCTECSLEHETLVATGPLPPEVPIFHLVRAVHMAGRCVDCGLCEDVCPMNIPLRLLYRKVNEIVAALFDYETGTSADQPPLNILGDKVILEPKPLGVIGDR